MQEEIKKPESPEFEKFYLKLVSLIPELKNYVNSSITAAENQGLIDRGYYDSEGILDEVFLHVFEQYSNTPWTELKFLLFKKSHEKIIQLIRDEEYTPNDPSTTGILKGELQALNFKFTADADGEVMIQDELDDISYQQERRGKEPIYLDDSLIAQIIVKFQLEDKFILAKDRRILLGELYSAIPPTCRSIVEFYVYGSLDEEEISKVLDVEIASVNRVLKVVREKFHLI